MSTETVYDDASKTEPLEAPDRRSARDYAVAVGQDVGEMGNLGDKVQVEGDLLLLAEYVIRLIDQIDRAEAERLKPVCCCQIPLLCDIHGLIGAAS